MLMMSPRFLRGSENRLFLCLPKNLSDYRRRSCPPPPLQIRHQQHDDTQQRKTTREGTYTPVRHRLRLSRSVTSAAAATHQHPLETCGAQTEVRGPHGVLQLRLKCLPEKKILLCYTCFLLTSIFHIGLLLGTVLYLLEEGRG